MIVLGWWYLAATGAGTRSRGTRGASTQRHVALQDRGAELAAARDADAEPREAAVDDPAGQLLWASPTAGAPISLAYVPAGRSVLCTLGRRCWRPTPKAKKFSPPSGPGARRDGAARVAHRRQARRARAALITVVAGSDGALDVCVRSGAGRAVGRRRDRSAACPTRSGATSTGRPFAVAGNRAWFHAARRRGRHPAARLSRAPRSWRPNSSPPPASRRRWPATSKRSSPQPTPTARRRFCVEPQFLPPAATTSSKAKPTPLRDALAVARFVARQPPSP